MTALLVRVVDNQVFPGKYCPVLKKTGLYFSFQFVFPEINHPTQLGLKLELKSGLELGLKSGLVVAFPRSATFESHY